MKKIITLAMIACMAVLVLAGCGGNSGADASAIPENPGNVYRVIVNDEAGQAVAGVNVQFCSDTLCELGETDENGIATFEKEEGDYHVKILAAPEGYAKDETEYPAPKTYGDVTITLKAAE